MLENKIFNTGETSDELRIKYNPDGSNLRKAQIRMLDMLIYLDKVCKEQNISYRLDAGNVLGAIRHGGFIPWDDDVDIVLSRKDSKRLCNYLINNPHPQYKLQSFETDYGYVGAWSVLRDMKSEYIQDSKVHKVRKYRGLQIDIFPYENRIIVPLYTLSAYITRYNNIWFVGKHMRIARIVHSIQYSIFHPIFRFLGLLFGNPNVYRHSYGAVFNVEHTPGALFPFRPIEFENKVFYGPANPCLYCEETYGKDYMSLPPQENRNHHRAKVIIWD